MPAKARRWIFGDAAVDDATEHAEVVVGKFGDDGKAVAEDALGSVE
jgi:hypothetical protein